MMWQKLLKNMVFMSISQSILNRCIQWETIALYRIFMTISAVLQEIILEGYNWADISNDDEGL